MNCECAICKNNKPFELPDEIIEAAIKGELVLFCGAGISTEGKNVLPFSFYSSIQEELGVEDNSISFSSLMQQYCNQPNGRKKLLKKIRERFQYIHSFAELERQATQFHRELAEIHSIHTIITTNWDTYFEQYCGAVPITIPEDFAFWDERSRFVLKIHGSIDNLSSVIATSEDYEKCYKQLQNGVIGATLKNILATKTVVFIGFSFGDEDFAQIMEYLRNEMGELYPHIYMVTLDDILQERLNYRNCTSIITSGTYFLHQLKNVLIEKETIRNCNTLPLIETALEAMELFHGKVSEIDLSEFPCAIYTLAYQDGVIHAWERFLQNYNTGEYNCPDYIGRVGRSYEKMTADFYKSGNYWDMSYYEGYTNGIILIGACDMEPKAIQYFPFLFLPNAKKDLKSFEVYMEELKRVTGSRSKYTTYARKSVKGTVGNGIVAHHPPYSIR